MSIWNAYKIDSELPIVIIHVFDKVTELHVCLFIYRLW